MKEFVSKSAANWCYKSQRYIRHSKRAQANFFAFVKEHMDKGEERMIFAVISLMIAIHKDEPLIPIFEKLMEEFSCNKVNIEWYIVQVFIHSKAPIRKLNNARDVFEDYFEVQDEKSLHYGFNNPN